jgi:DNA-directed RNA polymerase specialized sigma24 family protein
MRVVLGFTVEEIAHATDVSVNTVKTRLRLGKKSLRKLLASHAWQGTKEPAR